MYRKEDGVIGIHPEEPLSREGHRSCERGEKETALNAYQTVSGDIKIRS